MTSPTIPANIQAAIDDLTPDMKSIVQHVEHDSISAGTTQNNYGGYMSTLMSLNAKGGEKTLFIICKALIAAGGNATGIKAAAALITGRDPLQTIGR